MLARVLQYIFFLLIVHPVVLIVIGLTIRNQERLPKKGPAIIAANHNSHLDTVVLMSLYPLRMVHRLRPAAAADYFLSNKWIAWFSTNIIGIVPIERKRVDRSKDPLQNLVDVLNAGSILIFFPEGSRGEPEQLSEFKTGIARLAERNPDAEVVPVFLRGLGKVLPKGDFLPVPFFGEVNVGMPMRWDGDRDRFMEEYTQQMEQLNKEVDRFGA
ncbi:MAG: lysophospholipid acyltransferase family protein [Chloroflexota bacterium]